MGDRFRYISFLRKGVGVRVSDGGSLVSIPVAGRPEIRPTY